MRRTFDPFRLVLVSSFTGWSSQQERDVTDYFEEESRVSRELSRRMALSRTS